MNQTSRDKVIRDLGRDLRRAVDKRQQDLEPSLKVYDHAVEHGNDDDITSAAVMLSIIIMTRDPVRTVLDQYDKVMQLLSKEI